MHVPRPRVPRREPRPVDTKHIETLLASDIHLDTKTKILLMAYAGWRVSEVARAHGKQFDLIANRFTLKGKGAVEVTLPLHPILAEEARLRPRRGLWFPSPVDPHRSVRGDSVSTLIANAFARCGIDATAHQLRHWFASELLARGVDVRVVQVLMRHASLATTQVYTAVPDEMRRAAISKLPNLNSDTWLQFAIQSSTGLHDE
ncbi:tyrosine-type recombinase/integrase [Rarobacter faecitabidus]|nr:site-specific integrase [Rarobacter faecitabidus]